MSRKDAILSMRQVLVKRRDALRKALAGDLSLLKELRAQTSGDVVDAALDSVQDEISSQLAEVESRELARIEYALERMRSGQYGNCEGCGTNIPMARLNALPYATYCIKCQREAERQGTALGSSDVDWSRLLDVAATTPTCRSTTSSWTFPDEGRPSIRHVRRCRGLGRAELPRAAHAVATRRGWTIKSVHPSLDYLRHGAHEAGRVRPEKSGTRVCRILSNSATTAKRLRERDSESPRLHALEGSSDRLAVGLTFGCL